MDLAQVGLALDQEEKNAMAEMGMETKEFLQFVAVSQFSFVSFLILKGRFIQRCSRWKF